MGRHHKLLQQIVAGTSDANVRFTAMRGLLTKLGFDERIRGDHHIFTRTGVEEILNLQPKGAQCKAYQVAQVRNVIVKYGLAGSES